MEQLRALHAEEHHQKVVHWIVSGEAAAALLQAKVPTVALFGFTLRSEKRPLRRARTVTTIGPILEGQNERTDGWILGELAWDWDIPEAWNRGGESVRHRPQLTALLNATSSQQFTGKHRGVRVFRVAPCEGGYIDADRDRVGSFADWEQAASVIEGMIAPVSADRENDGLTG